MRKINIDNKILISVFTLLVIIIIFLIYNCEANTIRFIENYSQKWEVDSRVAYSLMKIESMGDRKAISNKDCIGLLQVSIIVYREYFNWKFKQDKNKKWIIYANAPVDFIRNHLKISSVNICIGLWHFRNLLTKFKGNYIQALNAYLNGNKKNISWDYLHKIIDDIVRFE